MGYFLTTARVNQLEHNKFMYKICLSFFLIIFSCTAYSKSYSVEIGPKSIELERQGQALYFSPNKKSQALSAITQGVNLSSREVSGVNPGSAACKKLKGKVILGKLWNGHSQSFCLFADQSLVSCQGIKFHITQY
jgi:hypothetical protein